MFLLEKLISLTILSPLPIIIILIYIGISLFRKRKKQGILLILIGVFTYFVTTDYFIDRALYPIENRYPQITQSDILKGDAYILLGGGLFIDTGGGDVPTPNALDRIVKTAIYYKISPKKIFISGGAPLHNKVSESKIYRKYLIDLGVNRDDIIIEEKSRTTKENAKFISEHIKDEDLKSVILITSAYHMERSIYIFSRYLDAIDILPAPCNYLSSNHNNQIFNFIPKYYNFLKFQIVIWETIGNIYYKIR